MAEVADGGKGEENEEFSKKMYSCSFKSIESTQGALKVSKDGQICLITGSEAHIMRQKTELNTVSTSLKFNLMLLAAPSDEACYDVGVDPDVFCLQPTSFPESYSFVMDRSLNPNRENLASSTFIDSVWSPSGLTSSGSCLLAVLSANNRVYITKENMYTGVSKLLIDITKSFYDAFKENKFIDTSIDIPENLSCQQNLSKEFFKYKQRQYYLAVTGIDWCPCTFMDKEIELKKLEDNRNTMNSVSCFLCGCSKLGMVVVWQIITNMKNDQISVKGVGSTIFSNEYPTNVSWYQEYQSQKGCIAVSFSNGLIKLWSIELIPAGNSIQFKDLRKYGLWMEEDLLQVKFIEWLKKNDDVFLVATKDSNIIIFKIDFDENQEIVAHSFKITPSSHDQPISALCCKDDYIVTTSLDGHTERFYLGEEKCETITEFGKPGNSCIGMQISGEGWFLMQMFCPTSMVYRFGKKPKESEFIITPFKSLKFAEKYILQPENAPTLEMYEYFRVLATDKEIPSAVHDFASTNKSEDMSFAQLQKKIFFGWLIKNAGKNNNCSLTELDFTPVFLKVIVQTLKNAVEVLQRDASLDKKSRKFVLLCSDWLITRGNNDSEFQLANLAYKFLDDKQSVKTAKLIWRKRHASQPSLRANETSQPNNLPENATVQMPPRETCPVCKRNIWLENERFATCERGHKWMRCSLTLFILCEMKCRTCIFCGRPASCKDLAQTESLFTEMINKDYCCYCNCRLLDT